MSTDTPRTDTAARHIGVFGDKWVPRYASEKLELDLADMTEQRDRLATILQNIRSGYGGQIPDPTCDCGDCEFLITIDNALQYITKSN
jgi:hypothetical protein